MYCHSIIPNKFGRSRWSAPQFPLATQIVNSGHEQVRKLLIKPQPSRSCLVHGNLEFKTSGLWVESITLSDSKRDDDEIQIHSQHDTEPYFIRYSSNDLSPTTNHLTYNATVSA